MGQPETRPTAKSRSGCEPAHEDAMSRRFLPSPRRLMDSSEAPRVTWIPLRRHQPPIRGRTRPTFRYGAPGPTRVSGLEAHGFDGVAGAIVDAQRGSRAHARRARAVPAISA